MPSLSEASSALDRAARDLGEQYEKKKAAEAKKKRATEAETDAFARLPAPPGEGDIRALQALHDAETDAQQELDEETRKYGEKLRAFLLAQQAYAEALQNFLASLR
jgi:hypothetical protein